MSAGWTAGEMLPDWTPVGRRRANRERGAIAGGAAVTERRPTVLAKRELAGVYDLTGLRATVGWREAMAVRGVS